MTTGTKHYKVTYTTTNGNQYDSIIRSRGDIHDIARGIEARIVDADWPFQSLKHPDFEGHLIRLRTSEVESFLIVEVDDERD